MIHEFHAKQKSIEKAMIQNHTQIMKFTRTKESSPNLGLMLKITDTLIPTSLLLQPLHTQFSLYITTNS